MCFEVLIDGDFDIDGLAVQLRPIGAQQDDAVFFGRDVHQPHAGTKGGLQGCQAHDFCAAGEVEAHIRFCQ